MTTTERPEEPTVDFETLFQSEDFQQLLEVADAQGSIKTAEVAELLDVHGFDPVEADLVFRELEARGYELIEDERETTAAVLTAPVETTTDALQLFLREQRAFANVGPNHGQRTKSGIENDRRRFGIVVDVGFSGSIDVAAANRSSHDYHFLD